MRTARVSLLFLQAAFLCAILSAGTPSKFHEFAHVVDGGGLRSTFLISNTTDQRIEITFSFYRDDGSPWSLAIDGDNRPIRTLDLPAGGVFRLETDGAEAEPTGGWGRLEATEAVGAQILFEFRLGNRLVTQAAVESTGPIRNADLFVLRDEEAGVNTGIAVASLVEVGETRVRLTLVAADGTELDIARFRLDPLAHRASFLNEFFSGLDDVSGVLRVSASGPITITTLQQSGLILGTLPPVVRNY